jgi:hypothetical protein
MWLLLLIVGLVALAIGLRFFLKMKKLASAPFKKTGEIAANPAVADAKGMISAEGQIVAPQPVTAPCSGQPCLYYEVTVEREWEKMVKTQKGNERRTGTTKVVTNKMGAIFHLDDGSGPVNIDAREGVDGELQKTHDERVTIGMMLPGELQFGQMRIQTPMNLGPERTLAFRAIEKTLSHAGNLYACGKLVNGAVSKPGWSSLIVSHKGREVLLGSTKKKAMAGLIVGGLFVAGAIPAAIFAPKTASASAAADTHCKSLMTDAVAQCDDTLTDEDGNDYKWTVSKPGVYTIRVVQPNVANPIDSTLTIKDAKGAQVAYNDGGSPGVDAHITQRFEAGTYNVNVRDFAKEVVEGGYTYSLVISTDSAPVAASAVAGTTTVSSAAVPAAAKKPPAGPAGGTSGATAGGKGTTPKKK